MKSKARWVVILLSIAGAGVCASVVVMFLSTIMNNNLPYAPDQGAREHYVAVGQSFSQGFASGFFLCFFLTFAAYLIGTQVERKRRDVGRKTLATTTAMLTRTTPGEL